eukprot:jgi/Ulvmu1/11702/UM008_0113.1
MSSTRRSHDASIVDRLLAARQAGAKLRGGDPSQPGSNETGDRSTPQMTSSQRSGLVAELLKLRQQNRPSEGTAHVPLPSQQQMSPALQPTPQETPTPPRSALSRNPGELVSPASSPRDSERHQSASPAASPLPHPPHQQPLQPLSATSSPARPRSSPQTLHRSLHTPASPQYPLQQSVASPQQLAPTRVPQLGDDVARLACIAGRPDSSVFFADSRSLDSLRLVGIPQPQHTASPQHLPLGRSDLRPSHDDLLLRESSCMVLRGEASEQPPADSCAAPCATGPGSPQLAWHVPTGACADIQAGLDGAARPQLPSVPCHLQPNGWGPGGTAAAHADAAGARVEAPAAGGGGREVSFGQDSVTTAGTQSIFFAEDLLREQRTGSNGGAGFDGRTLSGEEGDMAVNSRWGGDAHTGDGRASGGPYGDAGTYTGAPLSWQAWQSESDGDFLGRPHDSSDSCLPRPPRLDCGEISAVSDLNLSEVSDLDPPHEQRHAPPPQRQWASSSGAVPHPASSAHEAVQPQPARGREAVDGHAVDGRQREEATTTRSRPRHRSPQHERSRQELLDAVMRERAARTGGQAARATRGRRRGDCGRIAQLAQPRSVERYALQHADEAHAELQECTFAPKLCARSERVCRAPHRRDLSLPPGERLFHAHDHVRKARDRKAAEAANDELTGCTFRPQLRARSARRGGGDKAYVPIQKRAGELVKQRNARLAQTRLEQDACDPNATFQPALNQRSLRLAEARHTKGSPTRVSLPSGPPPYDITGSGGRASRAASCGPGRRAATEAGGSRSPLRGGRGKAAADMDACTFRPAVNEATDAYLNRSGIPATFEERQAFYEKRRRELAHVKRRQADDKECTFRPVTANPEDVLAASTRRVHLDETPEEFWLRLNEEAVKRATALQAIDNIQAAQYSFQPAINSKSRRMARKKGLEELSAAPQRAAFREAAAHAAEQRLSNECTFHPDTSKPCMPPGYHVAAKAPFSVAAESAGKLTERIHEYREEKGRKLEEIRNRREFDELAECTFAPAVNPRAAAARRAASRKPVLVRGLAAHLGKQEQAQRKATEEAELRARLFLERPRPPRAKFTIAQPFKLSNAAPGRVSKKEAMRTEVRSEAMKECTFKPKTNEGKKRQALEQILAADAALFPGTRHGSIVM